MNKIILIFATLLFSTGALARGCGDLSLKGIFSYEVSGVDSSIFGNSSTHSVGQATFDGEGNVTLIGVRTSVGGDFEPEGGTGTYKVNADCTASGLIGTFKVAIILDQMDNVPTPNKAYHGAFAITDTDQFSGSGSLTRLVSFR